MSIHVFCPSLNWVVYYQQEYQGHSIEEKQSLQQMVWGQGDIHTQINKIGSLLVIDAKLTQRPKYMS